MPFMDDKDYTDLIPKEEPNPEDTGSLPDLSEYLQSSSEQEMKLLKKADPVKFEEITSEKVAQEEIIEPESVPDREEAGTVEETLEKPDGIQKLSELLFGNKLEETDALQETVEPEAESRQESTDTAVAEEAAETVEQQTKETVEQDLTVAEEEPESNAAVKIEIDPSDFPRISQSGTGITQDLAKEISAIYEAEHQAQLKEKAVTVIQELPHVANEVVERMTEAEPQSETKTYTPLDMEEIQQEVDLSDDTVVVPDLATESGTSSEPEQKREVPIETVTGQTDAQGIAAGGTGDVQQNSAETVEEPAEETIKTADKAASDLDAELQLLKALEAELQEVESKVEKAVAVAEPELAKAVAPKEPVVTATAQDVIAAVDRNLSERAGEETASAEENRETEVTTQEPASATGEVLAEKDLPTTRALHRSFADILILIGGEMDPSHFVLMGDGKERILGIAKKIAVVMRETGYLSSGRIAHIGAEQLNQMELSRFKKQLKGNCLLITNAAELLFPTITKVFSIMDEFYGDFTVILSDEGATLDQLFRFVPALARRFKYIIDISQYTEQDYQ